MFFILINLIYSFIEEFQLYSSERIYSFTPFYIEKKGSFSLYLKSLNNFNSNMQLILANKYLFSLLLEKNSDCVNSLIYSYKNFSFSNKSLIISIDINGKDLYFPFLIKCDVFGEEIKGKLEYFPTVDSRSKKVFFSLIFSIILISIILIILYYLKFKALKYFLIIYFLIILINLISSINYLYYFLNGFFLYELSIRFFLNSIYYGLLLLIYYILLTYNYSPNPKMDLFIMIILIIFYSFSYNIQNDYFSIYLSLFYFYNLIEKKVKDINHYVNQKFEERSYLLKYIKIYIILIILTFLISIPSIKINKYNDIFLIETFSIWFCDFIFIILIYLINNSKFGEIFNISYEYLLE